MRPWIVVTLIAIGVEADVLLTLTHNPVSSLIPSIVVAAVGVVQAYVRDGHYGRRGRVDSQ